MPMILKILLSLENAQHFPHGKKRSLLNRYNFKKNGQLVLFPLFNKIELNCKENQFLSDL